MCSVRMKDPFEVLGIPRDADSSAIKSAYRKLAMKYHPDKNPDDAETATARFKEVSEAYETLTKEPDLEDMFGGGGMHFDPSMFAHMFRSQARVHVVTVKLDLKEIVEGTNVEARMQTTQKCKSCVGKSPTKKVICKTCGGNGYRTIRIMDMELTTLCTDCNGGGTVLQTDCQHCDGLGSVTSDETYNVYIPPGCSPGDTIATENAQCVVRIEHDLPEHICIVKNDIVITEFVTIKDILVGFARKIHLYDKRFVKIRCNQPMNPEDTYISKVKGIKNGQIKIVWSVIWDMVPIITAAPAIREALRGKKQVKRDAST